MWDEFRESMRPSFPGFMNEKMARVPAEGRPTKQLYLNGMRLFEYDLRDKRKRWAKKTAAREKRRVFHIHRQFEDDGEQGSSSRSRNSKVVVLKNVPTRTGDRPRFMPFSPLVREEKYIESAPYWHSPPCKKEPHPRRFCRRLVLSTLRVYVREQPLQGKIC